MPSGQASGWSPRHRLATGRTWPGCPSASSPASCPAPECPEPPWSGRPPTLPRSMSSGSSPSQARPFVAPEADMRRAVICALVALVVVILQVSVVDGLPIPGVSAADPALVAVVAVGLLGGPVTGALIGFFAGLWLDLVPPGGHLIGSSALLLCLVGYCCGLLCTWLYRSVMGLLIAGVVAVAAG